MLVIEQVTAPTDDARALLGELDAELSADYVAEQRHGLTLDRLFRRDVMFFMARLGGTAVGCGGVAFDVDRAEVKRMYVRPAERQRGVAQAILARLEIETRARGIRRLVLETGDGQLAAMRFYERAGFARCPAFGAYASMPRAAIARSVFFEKHIG